ncbi:MAG: HAMP domain-containing sensor histidine kinase [Candidatus Pacebacteria bacterium]|nr:HAMP domain-containing sensor histidine kinase [Candidatus Paceibacterota bacterium]
MKILNPFARIFRSWSWRLAMIYVLVFGMSVLALLAFVYFTTLSSIDADINSGLKSESQAFAKEFERRGPQALILSIKEHITENGSDGSIYLLTDSDFVPILGTIPRWPDEMLKHGDWNSFNVEKIDSNGDYEQLTYGRAILLHLNNGMHLLVGNNLQQRDSFIDIIEQSIIWAIAAMLTLAILGGWFISNNVSKRIELVNRTTRHIMDGYLGERVPITGSNDEFDRLAINLNEMLATINRLMNSMREVTDNIAHDLRSPLTRIKSRLEITLLTERTIEPYRSAIEATIIETDRLLATFNALLLIAETEARIGADLSEAVNLPLVAQDVIELFAPLAESKGMNLRLDHRLLGNDRGLVILGNRNLIFQAIANLIDNAIKYGHNLESNQITVALKPQKRSRTLILSVSDNGTGIPANGPTITDRFVRLENSRTSEGNGLGLSLVKAVAEMHKARLEFTDNHPGLSVRLIFPIMTSENSPHDDSQS